MAGEELALTFLYEENLESVNED